MRNVGKKSRVKRAARLCMIFWASVKALRPCFLLQTMFSLGFLENIAGAFGVAV